MLVRDAWCVAAVRLTFVLKWKCVYITLQRQHIDIVGQSAGPSCVRSSVSLCSDVDGHYALYGLRVCAPVDDDLS